jgi:hypothetical protein
LFRKIIQEAFRCDFLLKIINKLLQAVDNILATKLRHLGQISRYQKIMYNKWMLKKRPQPQLFELPNALVLAYLNLQVMNRHNLSCCNITMDECIHLTNNKPSP